MASSNAPQWFRGIVKGVPSGDTLLVMEITKSQLPHERTITLSSIEVPKLGRNNVPDEPFAWNCREYLRKLCIGKEILFRIDYAKPAIRREFGSVFLEGVNLASCLLAEGWAKVRGPGPEKGQVSPYLPDLLRNEEQAKQQGLGRWTRVPGASEASIRKLPPSAVGDPSSFDAVAMLDANKGRPLQAIVDQVLNGTTLFVYLLPELRYVKVLLAGIQAPSSGRKGVQQVDSANGSASNEQNGEATPEAAAGAPVKATQKLASAAPVTAAQRLASATVARAEVAPEPYGREAKHFTETKVLHRDVRIVLEGVDKYSSLIGSVHYPDGESVKDLSLELIELGYAKYVEWSASLLEPETKKRLKNAELQAKKDRLRIWTNYVPPASNSKAIHQNFSGKVVEVVSADCIVVADDSLPVGHPSAERRVNLSSIRGPKMGNPRTEQKPDPYAREAKEFLRTRLIGRQVHVSMEYSRKVSLGDGAAAASSGPKDMRIMDYGSVFLVNPSKKGEESAAAPHAGTKNIAELLVARGYATVVRHRDFEERSNYYDALVSAESRAISGKKGMHSTKEPPVRHMKDLLTGSSAKKARDFLPFLQRERRMPAVVQFLFSGHRFKIDIPKETCSIAFSLSGVRCPARNEPYSNEAILFMRHKIMQRDVEVEIETVDRTGTFLGTLWESNINVAIPLLEAGLAKLQKSVAFDKIPDSHLLVQAEQSAKLKKLKIWENYVEGEKVPSNGPVVENRPKKQKEELKVVITEVLGGGKFYVQSVADQKLDSILQQISSLNLQEPPVLGTFNPKKGDIVLARFNGDNSWNRAMIVNAPRGAAKSANDKFEVFYIDYGNQETVAYSQLRALDNSVSSGPGLAQLCGLAYIKVPNLEDDYGHEATVRLSEYIYNTPPKEFKAVIEEKESPGKAKGQGTGTILMVTLIDTENDVSVNALMLQDGLARLEKRRRQNLEELEKYQDEAREKRLGMWEYGDIESDDDDVARPTRRAQQRNSERKSVSQPQGAQQHAPVLLDSQLDFPSLGGGVPRQP